VAVSLRGSSSFLGKSIPFVTTLRLSFLQCSSPVSVNLILIILFSRDQLPSACLGTLKANLCSPSLDLRPQLNASYKIFALSRPMASIGVIHRLSYPLARSVEPLLEPHTGLFYPSSSSSSGASSDMHLPRSLRFFRATYLLKSFNPWPSSSSSKSSRNESCLIDVFGRDIPTLWKVPFTSSSHDLLLFFPWCGRDRLPVPVSSYENLCIFMSEFIPLR